jgi:hypothetical protein
MEANDASARIGVRMTYGLGAILFVPIVFPARGP